MAQPEQVLSDKPAARPVIDEDPRHAGQRRARGKDWYSSRVAGLLSPFCRDRAGKQEGVSPSSGTKLAEQLAELRRINFQEVRVDIEIDQLHPESGRTEDLAGAGGEFAEIPRAQRREDDADGAGLPTSQGRGQMRRREIQPISGLDDPLPGRWADTGDAAERT